LDLTPQSRLPLFRCHWSSSTARADALNIAAQGIGAVDGISFRRPAIVAHRFGLVGLQFVFELRDAARNPFFDCIGHGSPICGRAAQAQDFSVRG
jgi:hypothetical protein